MDTLKGLLKVVVWFAIIGGIAALIGWAFLFEVHRSDDNAMAPSLIRGDSYLVYIRSSFNRGTPAVCEHPREPGHKVVGRVLAVGGEKIAIKRGVVEVNGRPLRSTSDGTFVLVEGMDGDSPITQEFSRQVEEAGMISYPVLWPLRTKSRDMRDVWVPAGDLFLLADNRGSGVDSRAYGTVRETGCSGRPFMVYSPGPSSGDAERLGRWFHVVD